MHNENDPSAESAHDRETRLSADVLGQLDDHQRRLLEVDLQADSELRGQHEELLQIADALSHQHAAEPLPLPSAELRRAIQARLDGTVQLPEKPAKPDARQVARRRTIFTFALTAGLLVLLLAVPLSQLWRARQTANPLALTVVPADNVNVSFSEFKNPASSESSTEDGRAEIHLTLRTAEIEGEEARLESLKQIELQAAASAVVTIPPPSNVTKYQSTAHPPESRFGYADGSVRQPSGQAASTPAWRSTAGLRGVNGADMGPGLGGTLGNAPGMASGPGATAPVYFGAELSSPPSAYGRSASVATVNQRADQRRYREFYRHLPLSERSKLDLYFEPRPPTSGGERYAPVVENPFLPVSHEPLSTLSIDVDTASYANVRRFLTQNKLPPADAVRIEELINYFSYDYPGPEDDRPFASHLEVTECPWQPLHRLVRVGLQGKTIARQERPGCNLVFLLDVSGSMKDANKLPLLKQAMKLLVDQLDENDRVAIVTYASQAGVRLKSTVADKHNVIRDAINGLNANGSTNGGAGIQLAYEEALAGAIEGGVNRVILATDGDLNVGITDDDALVRLIKEKAASKVFLTVLGFGEGNLQDGKLEKLADNGNGVYAYIDNLSEARKVLVEQIEGSLVTIAKDVKIKVEFNPAEVQAYRLIGYENRLMTAAEFDDDRKDAGEIGAGHSVTALYEIVPAAPVQVAAADPLKYQQPAAPAVPAEQLTDAARTGELLTLSLRYKLPDEDESTLLEVPLLNSRKRFSEASMDFRFATAVASFGMLLRDSAHRGDTSFAAVEEIASAALGKDEQGYRTEFLDLVRRAATLLP